MLQLQRARTGAAGIGDRPVVLIDGIAHQDPARFDVRVTAYRLFDLLPGLLGQIQFGHQVGSFLGLFLGDSVLPSYVKQSAAVYILILFFR